jgi:hypothetical protein
VAQRNDTRVEADSDLRSIRLVSEQGRGAVSICLLVVVVVVVVVVVC